MGSMYDRWPAYREATERREAGREEARDRAGRQFLTPAPQGGYMPEFSRAGPGGYQQAPPGYAANPYQTALAQQIRTQQGPGIQQAQPASMDFGMAGRSGISQLIAALRGGR